MDNISPKIESMVTTPTTIEYKSFINKWGEINSNNITKNSECDMPLWTIIMIIIILSYITCLFISVITSYFK